MRKTLILLIITTCISITTNAQKPKIVEFYDVSKYLHPRSDTIYILNFWATWCKPCVKEIPEIEAIANSSKYKKIKPIYISLDFKSDYEKRLIPFLKEHKLSGDVLLLDEPDYDTWVPHVEPKWDGAIPFTIIVRGRPGVRYWEEGALKEKDFDEILMKYFGYDEDYSD